MTVRAALVAAFAVVGLVAVAAAIGASPSTAIGADPSAGASADPNPAASAAPGTVAPKGDRHGFKGFGPGFGDFGRAGFREITITAINGQDVSLKTADGWTRTITVTADTKVTKGGEPATASDIEVGDTVRLGQKRNADGSFTVTAVAIVLPRVGGTVTAVDSSSITITDRKGAKQTIHTNASTKYHAGDSDGTRADVTVGAKIVAVGEQGSDGSLTATSVTVNLPRVAGTISSVSGNTITLTDRKGAKHTIHVTSATKITVFGTGAAKVTDLKAGMVMAAEGRQRSDGSLDATAIGAGTPRERGNGDKPGKGDHAAPSAAPSATTG